MIYSKKASIRGFTLIELLAVIAILGILAGLVLVATSRIRKQARDTQRKAIVRAISEAEEAYYNDNYDKALKFYKKAIELDPTYDTVYNNIGSIFLIKCVSLIA